MAADITSTERYCSKFQLDNSTNKKCRFIHQLMNEQQKKESGFAKNRPFKDRKNYDLKWNNKDKKFEGKEDTRNSNSSGTNRMHNSVPLTREHQVHLGEPKGKVSELNPKGYSKFQNKLRNIIKYLNKSLNNCHWEISSQCNYSSVHLASYNCVITYHM